MTTASRKRKSRGRSKKNDAMYEDMAGMVRGLFSIPFTILHLIGVAIATAIEQLMSKRMLPLVGAIVAVLGFLICAEAYWLTFGGELATNPFLPKPGIEDGASVGTLLDIITDPLAGLTLLGLTLFALFNQHIESIPFKARAQRTKYKKSGKKQFQFILWVGVTIFYIVDLYSIGHALWTGDITPPIICYSLLGLLGPEIGLAMMSVDLKEVPGHA